jgi:Kdo2-lipid IVA lauroyltransferase/acyltransferase
MEGSRMSDRASADEPENQKFRWQERLFYYLFRSLICFLQILSLERCDRLCRILARLFSTVVPLRHKLIRENLKLIFPDWDMQRTADVQERMWHHLLLMSCEVAQAPRKVHRENWYEHFSIPDRRCMLQVVIDVRPNVLVSGHYGNFELAGFLTGLFGTPSTTIARPLDNGFVHNYVTKFRSVGGQHFLPKVGSSIQVQELLSQGGNLALLADQYAGPKGCWVDFMGKPASCHKGLALFTLSSGAPMVVIGNTRQGRPLQFEISVLGVADPKVPGEHLASVQSLTRWYNQCLEKMIRSFPEQYWWVHRRWRGEPPQKRSSRAA